LKGDKTLEERSGLVAAAASNFAEPDAVDYSGGRPVAPRPTVMPTWPSFSTQCAGLHRFSHGRLSWYQIDGCNEIARILCEKRPPRKCRWFPTWNLFAKPPPLRISSTPHRIVVDTNEPGTRAVVAELYRPPYLNAAPILRVSPPHGGADQIRLPVSIKNDPCSSLIRYLSDNALARV